MGPRAGTRLGLVVGTILVACGPTPGAQRASDLQPASLGEPASAALVVGCWSLDWGGGPGRGRDGRAVLPDSVRLRDEAVFATPERQIAPATHPSGRSATEGAPTPWEARYRINRWWIEDDLLNLRFSDGEEESWRVALTVESDGLTGWARHEGGGAAASPAGETAVRGTRITCDF